MQLERMPENDHEFIISKFEKGRKKNHQQIQQH